MDVANTNAATAHTLADPQDADSDTDSDSTMTQANNNPNTTIPDDYDYDDPDIAAGLQVLDDLTDENLQLRRSEAEAKTREIITNLGAINAINTSLTSELQRRLDLELTREMEADERRRTLNEAAMVRVLAPEEWHMLTVDRVGFCPGCPWCNGLFGPLLPGWPGC